MSTNEFSIKLFLKKCFSLKVFLISLFLSLIIPIFVLIFVFGLDRKWYDGLSVSALILICLGFLILVLNIAQFKTFSKLKNLFTIKKENNEQLTKIEKTQMEVLNIIKKDEAKTEIRKEDAKYISRGVSFFVVVIGFISLFISLPFLF